MSSKTPSPGAAGREIIPAAETGCDLTREEARALGVYLVPMHVSMGSETRPDGSFPAEEVCAFYERTGAVPQNLDYLRAGGRVSNAAALISGVLNLHPAIHVTGGKLVAERKYRGSMDKVARRLVRDEAEANALDRDVIYLIRSPGLSREVMDAAEDEVRRCDFGRFEWVKTGCVITCHGGPGAFGVVGFSSR